VEDFLSVASLKAEEVIDKLHRSKLVVPSAGAEDIAYEGQSEDGAHGPEPVRPSPGEVRGATRRVDVEGLVASVYDGHGVSCLMRWSLSVQV
jgi:hypothetical protein